MKKTAVFTMIYNEPEYLPIWLKYYGSQVGAENTFVLDHGSDDGSASGISCGGVVRLPRTFLDETKRADAVSNFCCALLNYYDTVIYTDVDEILVPNPSEYAGLLDFCSADNPAVISAVGLNLHHIVGEEPDFNLSESVLSQRGWVRFVSPMCKPLITRVPLRWGRGFHVANQPVVFGDIYLFHLRYFDLRIGLDRLSRTRNRALEGKYDQNSKPHQHQVLEDAQFETMMKNVAAISNEDVQFSLNDQVLRQYLDRSLDESGRVAMDVFADKKWRVPQEFLGAF